MAQDKAATIGDLLRPTVEGMGYELWGCEYHAQGHHSLLRVYIDDKSGVGIEACTEVSRQLSAVLDVESPLQGEYRLEVSSPGINRPLFTLAQYRQYMGYEVLVKLRTPIEARRKWQGELVEVTEASIKLKVKEDFITVPIEVIHKATLVEVR